MIFDGKTGVYGVPPAELAPVPPDAIQFSPLTPGAQALEAARPGSLGGFVLLAPPGTLERRAAMALALRAAAPGTRIVVLAAKDRGGTRLAAELREFGCEPEETARRHHRICAFANPAAPAGLEAAIAAGALQQAGPPGLWTQPGVFSWDRTDPGSALLAQALPQMAGNGADFGCGIGTLAAGVLASPEVKALALIDIDRRALAAAERNVADARISLLWADVRSLGPLPTGLDFIVMNPPFHELGSLDHGLGQEFIRQAAARLRRGGTLWLTANRHLPYEAVLTPLFRRLALRLESAGFKVFEAQK